MNQTRKHLILSGVTPTGNLHIGNYLGAIAQWKTDKDAGHHVYAMIADLHALTTPQDPNQLRQKTMEIARLLLACGLEKSVLFVQSHISAHAELAWILNTITPVGELQRMTQFKEKTDKAGALAGLLNYPVLMAADILLYRATHVPVGEDQQQHLELTRTLANKFNNRFGETFRVPDALIQKDTARLMALDDPSQKMSKSAASPANYIALLDPPDVIRNKIKAAVTDSGKEIAYDEKDKPAIANLIRIYAAFSGLSHSAIETRYRAKGYAEFKKDLGELLVEKLGPIQERYRELAKHKKSVIKILSDGARRANAVAAKTLQAAKQKVGFLLSD